MTTTMCEPSGHKTCPMLYSDRRRYQNLVQFDTYITSTYTLHILPPAVYFQQTRYFVNEWLV